MPTLLLVDGHSLAFRAYYAFAKSRDGGLRTSTGIPTSVCHGFLNALTEVISTETPSAIAIAFDRPEPTFRHEADSNYKANREAPPEDFRPDVENLKEVLKALGLQIVTEVGYEADDILGTLAQRGSAAGYAVKILSGDRDLFQLVDGERQISVLYMSTSYGKARTGKPAVIGREQVIEKLGVPPEQVVDYKALCGDSSDNIPGVKGVGPKTAVQLLQEYGDLQTIYSQISAIKPTWAKKLETSRDAAFLSQHLAQIMTEVPISLDLGQALEGCRLQGFSLAAVTHRLEMLELKEMGQRLSRLQALFGGEKPLQVGDSPALSGDFPGGTPGSGAGLAASFPMGAPVSLVTVNPVETGLGVSGPIEGEDEEGFWSYADTLAFQAEHQPLRPWVIQTPEALAQLVHRLRRCTDPQQPVAWDTETTALDPRQAELVGLGCAWGEGPEQLAYLPLGHRLGEQEGGNLDLETTLEALRPILESADYPKALQNAKFDRLILQHQGIILGGVVWDTLLASYVLNPSQGHSLDALADRYLQIQPQSYKDLVPKGKTIADVSIAEVAQYCGMDVHVTRRLVPILGQELAQCPALEQLRVTVEQPLEPVLAAMEDRGVRIDTAYLGQLSQQLEQELARLEDAAHQAAGIPFNLASPKQLSTILFENLGLDVKKSRKIKTGYSTDAAVLEKLRGDHPVVDSLLEHRTLAKLKSTYVDALPALVQPQTQRIHTDFNQAVTATGRLSSSNPNLQNIPIRTAFSRQIRKAFVPEPGWLMVAADYSQIELRILAHMSQEPILLEAYRTGEDVHTLTARLLLEKDEISSEERRLGKVINFGVIYGMGAQRFARETGVSLTAAKGFLQRFHDRYPQVFAYLQHQSQAAIALGYVTTLLGRRRYFQFSGDRLQRLQGRDPSTIDLSQLKSLGQQDAGLLRAAANAPIQGSSADIIKVAMVKMAEVLQPYRARMLLQVHDELVFEMPPEEWPELERKIKETMAQAVELAVPLEVEVHAGQNWMEAK
ncbi:MAG: DNA polymerase I [Prochlorothrix sp.]|nr:DNA polymerase I [Prochlorothrix sp.]